MRTLHESDEDSALRSTAAGIAEQCRSSRAMLGADHGACWNRLEQAGFLELRAPDDDGSPLATVSQTVIVVEELARAVCAAPLLGLLLGSELARLGGASSLVDGDPATVLLQADLAELGADDDAIAWDAGDLVERAVGLRHDAVVLRRLAESHQTQDLSRAVADPTGEAEEIGRLPADGLSAFTAFGRTLVAADLLGAAEAALESAVEYSGQRAQFGKPIGAFQAVQHLCAAARVKVEAQRSALLFAAWSLDSGRADAEVAALVAKAYGARAAVDVVETAVQVFGGVAITWEFPAHLHLRRVLLDAEVLGTADDLALAAYDWAEGAGGGLQ